MVANDTASQAHKTCFVVIRIWQKNGFKTGRFRNLDMMMRFQNMLTAALRQLVAPALLRFVAAA